MTDNWMEEENVRAGNLAKTGKTNNSNAPKAVGNTNKSSILRSARSIYIQDTHQKLLDKLIFEQKISRGKKAPELIEEAIELVAKKYNVN